ncbi:MAG: hypothetical protein NVS9B4_21890 [Candidatus Acidiferrum sp.]
METPLVTKIQTLRGLPTDQRARVTKDLALQIRRLPAGANKVRLALNLSNLSTEGDFGKDTLQEVATTLADSLRETPFPPSVQGPTTPYVELASLVRYEHVHATLDDPQFTAAMAKLESDDARRKLVNFTLTDLHGKRWTLTDLRGKVVLVNFWATWCPPCRSEMPDLDALYKEFQPRGLVILAMSDEEENKVRPFIEQHKFKYPVLLDPGGKVAADYIVEGIPKSFVYNREGQLVAQSIDMRTKKQFLELLTKAGLY